MATLGETIGGLLSSAKNALGLQNVDLIPGDVNKGLTGMPASQNYGIYNPNGGGQIWYNTAGTPISRPQVSPKGTVPVTNSVLGAASTSSPTMSGGVSSVGQQPSQPSQPSAEDLLQQEWNTRLQEWNNMFNSLSSNKTAQEQQAIANFNVNSSNLDLQNQQGQELLAGQRAKVGTNQAKNLKSLSSDLANSMQAGNVFLGARGAGDSSAANQYAFALTKLGNQQRTEIMNKSAEILSDIDAREKDLFSQYSTAKNNLKYELDNAMAGIAQWFSSAQTQLQQARAQDRASLSNQILNQAMNAMSMVQQQAFNRQTMLDQWVASTSQSVNEMKNKWAQLSNPNYQMPQAGKVAGAPQMDNAGNIFTGAPIGYGSPTDQTQQPLFANPSWLTG